MVSAADFCNFQPRPIIIDCGQDHWKFPKRGPKSMPLSDDPLAYLGILVDIIQEWNQYSVFKDLGREPIQGTEIDLGHRDGKVIVRFLQPNARKRAEKVIKDLDQALVGWSDILEVGFAP
jgi:hypothetical protein